MPVLSEFHWTSQLFVAIIIKRNGRIVPRSGGITSQIYSL